MVANFPGSGRPNAAHRQNPGTLHLDAPHLSRVSDVHGHLPPPSFFQTPQPAQSRPSQASPDGHQPPSSPLAGRAHLAQPQPLRTAPDPHGLASSPAADHARFAQPNFSRAFQGNGNVRLSPAPNTPRLAQPRLQWPPQDLQHLGSSPLAGRTGLVQSSPSMPVQAYGHSQVESGLGTPQFAQSRPAPPARMVPHHAQPHSSTLSAAPSVAQPSQSSPPSAGLTPLQFIEHHRRCKAPTTAAEAIILAQPPSGELKLTFAETIEMLKVEPSGRAAAWWTCCRCKMIWPHPSFHPECGTYLLSGQLLRDGCHHRRCSRCAVTGDFTKDYAGKEVWDEALVRGDWICCMCGEFWVPNQRRCKRCPHEKCAACIDRAIERDCHPRGVPIRISHLRKEQIPAALDDRMRQMVANGFRHKLPALPRPDIALDDLFGIMWDHDAGRAMPSVYTTATGSVYWLDFDIHRRDDSGRKIPTWSYIDSGGPMFLGVLRYYRSVDKRGKVRWLSSSPMRVHFGELCRLDLFEDKMYPVPGRGCAETPGGSEV